MAVTTTLTPGQALFEAFKREEPGEYGDFEWERLAEGERDHWNHYAAEAIKASHLFTAAKELAAIYEHGAYPPVRCWSAVATAIAYVEAA